ncbi:MAG: hypothetical protein GY797_21475 [Deltaproteobacteria bacterium]|nr:hypothetical protein [Deltaproteobacteria bacterium]
MGTVKQNLADNTADCKTEHHPRFQEWQECLRSIGEFDKMILSIRKYGFTFLTLLLTADGFLLGKIKVSQSSALGIYVVLLILIIALFHIDRMHEVFLRAAVLRAMDLEEELQLGLTRYIAYWSETSKTSTWGTYIYFLFCFAASALTVALLLNVPLQACDFPSLMAVIIFLVLTIFLIYVYNYQTTMRKGRRVKPDKEDPFQEHLDKIGGRWKKQEGTSHEN